MTDQEELEARLARLVAWHEETGELPSVETVCQDRPDLAEPLRALVDRYAAISAILDGPHHPDPPDETLPIFDGFRTVERIGAGGMGTVYKLQDLRLGRLVAAKVLRRDAALRATVEDFLREARALALFNDRRIVRIHEFRPDPERPVLIMELVEGFELGRGAPALEFQQRARIVAAICGALQRAHDLGLQHRDLKPSNIMLDETLEPRLLDFGLSGGQPSAGHLRGTLPYVAPEQIDPARTIDARTDVYALGVIFYELLCGARPFSGADPEVIEAIRAGQTRLPVEVEPAVPEPLQAVALKAMERDPAARYQTAKDMAEDIGRWLDGRPVLARPTLYAATLGARARTHLDQVQEWLRLKLIHPHEAANLASAYGALDARDEDWIVESRVLSHSQIALYLGAFFLLAGSLFYFGAHRVYESVQGVGRPFLVLGLPFLGLNAAAHRLFQRQHKAVAVAFFLGGAGLLPLFLLIWFHELGLWRAAPDAAGQLFLDGSVSNRQLQVTTFVAGAWCGWLALRTRTVALSTVCTAVTLLFGLALLADLGLRTWIEDTRFDRLALHVAPLVGVYALAGWRLDRVRCPWFARPLYAGAAVLLVVVLELLALDGRQFGYVGVTFQTWQRADISSPTLIDTLGAMTLNGVLFYVAAATVERRGTELMRPAAWLLATIAPFAMLQPLGYLSKTGEYSMRIDWMYLVLALLIAWLSQARQRKAFYYAGVLNAGWALWLIADHREWFDRPVWAVSVVAVGLALLAIGLLLAARERRT